MKNEKNTTKNKIKKQELNALIEDENKRINTDPNGSWTGVPDNPKEVPIQDADDL